MGKGAESQTRGDNAARYARPKEDRGTAPGRPRTRTLTGLLPSQFCLANKRAPYFRLLPFTLIAIRAIFVIQNAKTDQYSGEKGAARQVFSLCSSSLAAQARLDAAAYWLAVRRRQADRQIGW